MRTSAHLLRKYAPAAVGRPGPRTRTGTAGWTRRSRGPPYSMERATGHPRICFANTHRLQAPVGAFACSLQTLRVCLTLAPWRVRVPALGSKKHGNVTLPCLCFLLERATGLEPASVSLGSFCPASLPAVHESLLTCPFLECQTLQLPDTGKYTGKNWKN